MKFILLLIISTLIISCNKSENPISGSASQTQKQTVTYVDSIDVTGDISYLSISLPPNKSDAAPPFGYILGLVTLHNDIKIDTSKQIFVENMIEPVKYEGLYRVSGDLYRVKNDNYDYYRINATKIQKK